jgi:hypothetical protein
MNCMYNSNNWRDQLTYVTRCVSRVIFFADSENLELFES